MENLKKLSQLKQPDENIPILPREWINNFHNLKLTRQSDDKSIIVPCTSSNSFIEDLNPRWFVKSIHENKSKGLYTLYWDSTNKCTDKCPVCFTKKMREHNGIDSELDFDLAMKRTEELKRRYSDTFQAVNFCGPGEPLVYKHIKSVLSNCKDIGLTTRLYTNGERLKDDSIRESILKNTGLVRISLDAAEESTYEKTHGVSGLQGRLDNTKQLVDERNSSKSQTLIGAHFVIQKANYNEIIPFAEMVKCMGLDFVIYSQETLGTVVGGFDIDEKQKIAQSLENATAMHTNEFCVVVPKNVLRSTLKTFNPNYFAGPDKLSQCFNSKMRGFLGVNNDLSACWLADFDERFREASYIGETRYDSTMGKMYNIIENGLGSHFSNGTFLACDFCCATNYNDMVSKILRFLDGEKIFDVSLLQHNPEKDKREGYDLII